MAWINRPLMVIEDADDRPRRRFPSYALFGFVALRGARLGVHVIEDEIVDGLFDEERIGERPAIANFRAEQGGDYEIDQRFCNFCGSKVTWNVNSFPRRVR